MPSFLHYKKREKKIGRLIILLPIILILAGFFYYFYNLNAPNSNDSQIQEFVVEKGWGSTKISHELKDQGLIKSPLIFQFYTWKKKIGSRLLDGEYSFAKNLSIKEISWILSRGAGLTKEMSLTFIEGWNNQEVAEYLEEKGITASEDFFAVIQKKADWWDEYEFLSSRPKTSDLEGYLFPDTYRIYRDAVIVDVVKKMLDNFGKKVTPELIEEIESQNKTVHEILTLASILEKEVSTDEDRKIVADIFYKRLAEGMALQADSTVNYATGKSVARSSFKDLEVDSLYNTYKYRGLPPGPICNPGLSSINAATYPTVNDYWYFLTTPEGKVIYSRTHDEHVAAKAKYY